MFAAAFYIGTRPGLAGGYNRLVRAYEAGPYSHCEIVFSNGDSASSSGMDGGVRFTGDGRAFPRIDFSNGNWHLLPLPGELEAGARAYFVAHEGWSYDYRGNVRFLYPFGNRDSKLKKFCSEAFIESIGVREGWRFGVNASAAVAQRLGAAWPAPVMKHNLQGTAP